MLCALFHVANQTNAANIRQHSLQPSNVRPNVGRIVQCARNFLVWKINLCIAIVSGFKCEKRWKLHTRRWFFRTSPTFGSNSPINSFKNVDFPTPFGPTIATRLLKSIPKSVLMNNGGWLSKLNVTSIKQENILFVNIYNRWGKKRQKQNNLTYCVIPK